MSNTVLSHFEATPKQHIEQCIKDLAKTRVRTMDNGEVTTTWYHSRGSDERANLVAEAQFWLNYEQYQRAQAQISMGSL